MNNKTSIVTSVVPPQEVVFRMGDILESKGSAPKERYIIDSGMHITNLETGKRLHPCNYSHRNVRIVPAGDLITIEVG